MRILCTATSQRGKTASTVIRRYGRNPLYRGKRRQCDDNLPCRVHDRRNNQNSQTLAISMTDSCCNHKNIACRNKKKCALTFLIFFPPGEARLVDDPELLEIITEVSVRSQLHGMRSASSGVSIVSDVSTAVVPVIYRVQSHFFRSIIKKS